VLNCQSFSQKPSLPPLWCEREEFTEG
jgi:hypothetical protein